MSNIYSQVPSKYLRLTFLYQISHVRSFYSLLFPCRDLREYLMKTLEHNYIVVNFNFFSGGLMYLNEATLLHNIKIRYKKDKIYVSPVFY